MAEPRDRGGRARAWWLALAAMALCGPWPGWQPPWPVLGAAVAGLAVLARPAGRTRWPWFAVALALVAALPWPWCGRTAERLGKQLERHCSGMLSDARRIVAEPRLRRLFEAGGEALDPGQPFEMLQQLAEGRRHRTVYLADDRGRVVAWGGEQRAFPTGVRPIGERRWGVVWSASSATLYLREPLLVEGRLVGAITVSDWAPLEATHALGMSARGGGRLELGVNAPNAVVIVPGASPGVELPVAVRSTSGRVGFGLRWLAWAGLAVAGLLLRPSLAWLIVGVAGVAYLAAPGEPPEGGLAVLLLLAAASLLRASSRLAVIPARLVIVGGGVVAASWSLLAPAEVAWSWLPAGLLDPGPGAVWMVAMAWLVAGWPRRSRSAESLGWRLLLAGSVAVIGLVVDVGRVPLTLARASDAGGDVVLPRGDLELQELLPVEPERCDLRNLTSLLAARWRLDVWRTPSELVFTASDGTTVSTWGDLGVAGDSVRSVRRWAFTDLPRAALELRVATSPWSLLGDWRSGASREVGEPERLAYAVFTRSGRIAATLEPEIRDLDAATAGELFYAGGGWASVSVGGRARPARVWRRDDWLVAAVARSSESSVWVLRAAMATLWALLGLTLALPPSLRGAQPATFGGRLRLLVAGGVVVPLVILTVLLHLRLGHQETSLERAQGLGALQAARYTAIHLAGGFEVDDDLARWLATGWGGEVLLFEGAEVVAASRPDLVTAGILPQLPVPSVFPAYLVGRDDAVVVRDRDLLVAAGAIELQGRSLLLELIRPSPFDVVGASRAADWLATGALLAALLALLLTSRIERRLSVSLRDLVALARRLLDGEPLGDVQRPAETDLAEVIDAVRSMSEEVQRRELSLRHSEELLRITLSTLAQAVVVLETDGSVRFANASAERLMSSSGELVLATVRALDGGGEAPAEPVVETVTPIAGQDLTWRVGVAGVPLPDGSRGVVAVVDDVTDVVRVDRLRQLNQLARIVAHEVKNPLTPIRLWVQELDDARRRGEAALAELLGDACREIALQVERLQDTANSFSNLVALERWQAEDVDLAMLVEETLGSLTILARRGIEVRKRLPATGRCRVVGDRQWLQRALGNLVKNSVDALADQPGEIDIRVECTQTSAVLEVEDSAGGIAETALAELFSPHFSTTTAGSGLGLALVHQVVARCGGRVAAANGRRGLVVRLELPRRP